MDGEKSDTGERVCQDYSHGCCGCCVNMRWSDQRILQFMKRNTSAAKAIFPSNGRPLFRDLVRLHRRRGGWINHLLATILVMPTFGLSALVWKRFWGSCCFVGYLDGEGGHVGCLVHPKRVGEPDLRRYAFPLVPVLGCNRNLRCPMLDNDHSSIDRDFLGVSRDGHFSLLGSENRDK